MTLPIPYPADLIRIARKVVWHDAPENTLADANTFLAHLMVYGSPSDVAVVEKYVSREGFRVVLEHAPAGVFTADAWAKWHARSGITPIPALPRREFPDGSFGPEAGSFLGR